MSTEPEPPRAIVAPEGRRSFTWILPFAAALFAGWLVLQAWTEAGERIVVEASQGYGIEAGDSLRYRGITVGEIEDVRLAPDLGRVRLGVRLHPSARELARSGSRFWVVRPHLSLEGVQGLETIVGARYLSVLPGEGDGERRSSFVALDEPPIAERVEPGGLEVVVEAPSRFGLAAGAPVHYRGVRVGTLMSVALASDATSVELGVYVRPPYVPLVRENTIFWETGGFELDLGWVRGLEIEMDSLRSLLVGGLTMATPSEPGPEVGAGHRFPLSLERQDEWLAWRAAIPVGGFTGDMPERLPTLVRAELSWKEGSLFRKSRSRIGWLLPVAGGLLGPADLLRPDEDAREGSSVLTYASERLELRVEPGRAEGGLALLAVEVPASAAWPRALSAPADGPSGPLGDCLVVADPERQPAALSGARIVPAGDGWRIDGGPVLDETWHGAAVLELASGRLVGLLLHEGESLRVVPLRAEWL